MDFVHGWEGEVDVMGMVCMYKLIGRLLSHLLREINRQGAWNDILYLVFSPVLFTFFWCSQAGDLDHMERKGIAATAF